MKQKNLLLCSVLLLLPAASLSAEELEKNSTSKSAIPAELKQSAMEELADSIDLGRAIKDVQLENRTEFLAASPLKDSSLFKTMLEPVFAGLQGVENDAITEQESAGAAKNDQSKPQGRVFAKRKSISNT